MRGRRVLICAVALALALALVAGCGHGVTGSSARHQTAPAAAPSTAPSTDPEALHRQTADARACAGAQGVLGHVTVSTAQWSPTLHPFDKDVAGRLGTYAGDLDRQAALADSVQIRRSVHAMAVSFAVVSDAMSGRKRARVTTAITRSRVAYRDLKKVCAFDK